MFIPIWVLWVAFYIICFVIGIKIISLGSDYDFITPIIGVGIIIGSVLVGLGYIIGKL